MVAATSTSSQATPTYSTITRLCTTRLAYVASGGNPRKLPPYDSTPADRSTLSVTTPTARLAASTHAPLTHAARSRPLPVAIRNTARAGPAATNDSFDNIAPTADTTNTASQAAA